MKKLLVIAFAVSLCASAAVAADHYPTRDAAINKVVGWEEYASGGAMTQCRFMKARQHYMLMDFDWAAIEADMLANPGQDVVFSMVPVNDDLFYRLCHLVISENTVDWVEGDGTSQFTNFSWTNPTTTPAVTSQFAQTYEDALNPGSPDLAQCIGPWPWGDFDAKRSRAGYVNANKVLFDGLGGVRCTPIVLDTSFLGYLIAGTSADGGPSVGFYTYDGEPYGTGFNFEGYTSDAGQALSPMITVVPEPASMLLIGLGGIGMLLRKRR